MYVLLLLRLNFLLHGHADGLELSGRGGDRVHAQLVQLALFKQFANNYNSIDIIYKYIEWFDRNRVDMYIYLFIYIYLLELV